MREQRPPACAILGDGAFGTAFATLLTNNGHRTLLWCFNEDVAQNIRENQENRRFLPGIKLPSAIEPITNIAEACAAPWIFIATPVPFMRSILKQCTPFAKAHQSWVCLNKGIEQGTLCLPTEIIAQEIGPRAKNAVLSGPSFARDIATAQPTVVSVASKNKRLASNLASLLNNTFFACVVSNDPIGTQYAGALKNGCAIGTGILAGAGYGHNTQVRFALQYLEEIKALVLASGGKWATLYSPATIGDVILSCFTVQSRNYRFGLSIGKGETTSESLNGPHRPTIEGVNTLLALQQLETKHGFYLPLSIALTEIVEGRAAPQTLIDTLCSRIYLS
ncbi:MAG: NAD(P)H-dependent glycerol-3-phosphate dehydrogenase [Candidatus Babeliaceae bacterium]|nr:NAD(P)H-dependent glycerol-3-phosphate dehydrogenase [Candidatus Babeliaceae bacterium]